MISIEFTLDEIQHLIHGLRYLDRHYNPGQYTNDEHKDFLKENTKKIALLTQKLRMAKVKLYEESQKHEEQ